MVDTTFVIKDYQGVFELVLNLDAWLKQHQKGIFGAYSGVPPGLTSNSTTLLAQSRREASQLPSLFDTMPPTVAGIISGINDEDKHLLNNRLLNIEAMWSTVTAATGQHSHTSELPGNRLFHAILYILPKLQEGQVSVEPGLPKAFNRWIMAVVLLCHLGTNTEIFKKNTLGTF